MAIFRPAPILGAISGNVGGVCFVMSKSGPVIRKRIVRTKNTSRRHTELTIGLQRVRNAWRSLAEPQRAAWRQAALIFPNKNRLGSSTRLSGFQLFTKLNMIGYFPPNFVPFAIIEDPPVLTRDPPFVIDDFSVTSGGLKTLNLSDPVPSFYDLLLVSGARTFSTSQRKSWFSFRLIMLMTMPPTTLTIDFWDDFIGDPSPGEQCWVSLVQLAAGFLPQGPIVASTFAS